MHDPALDPSTRRPAPPPDCTLSRILVVNALVVGGILGLLVLVSYPVVFVGFVAGALVAPGYRRLRHLATRVRDRMGGYPRRPAEGPGTGSDSTLMRP